MTKFLRAGLFLLVLMNLAAYAYADAVWTSETVPVRRNRTKTSDPTFVIGSVDNTSGYVDSTVWSANVTGASTAAQQETTATFTLDNMANVPVFPGGVSAVDSLWGFRLMVHGTTVLGSATAFDTLTATLQASADGGASWAAAPAVRVVEPTSGNVGIKQWTFPGFNQASFASTPTNANILGAGTIYRLILGMGGTYGGTDSGQFIARILRWKTSNSTISR